MSLLHRALAAADHAEVHESQRGQRDSSEQPSVSFALAAGQTAGVVFFCSLAGFVFTKRQFPGRDALFLLMLV